MPVLQGTGNSGSNATCCVWPLWNLRWHVFPRLQPVACFPPALASGYMFFRACHTYMATCMHACSRACTLHISSTGYMFSRAWYELHVFPRLKPVGTSYMFFLTIYWLHVSRCMRYVRESYANIVFHFFSHLLHCVQFTRLRARHENHFFNDSTKHNHVCLEREIE